MITVKFTERLCRIIKPKTHGFDDETVVMYTNTLRINLNILASFRWMDVPNNPSMMVDSKFN